MFSSLALTVALLFSAPAFALPSSLQARQAITALTSAQISAFKPYTYYASTGYCLASQTIAWDCGADCQANADFKPITSGGDGNDTPYWYVGYDPSLETIIVSHAGTNTSEILSLLTDANIVRSPLDSTLFPGLSSDITVHDGFAAAQSNSAAAILSAVQSGLSRYGGSHVTVTGHSLGAAIALLDSVYLPLHISGITVTFIGYGLPRVGNQDFANYVDAQPISVTHINNKEDPIPILPGEFLGYVHPSGEVHIEDSGEWANCPGQDNPSTQCSTGDVPTLAQGDLDDHDGPYDGVEMGC